MINVSSKKLKINDECHRGSEDESVVKVSKVTRDLYKSFHSIPTYFGMLMHRNIIIRQVIHFYNEVVSNHNQEREIILFNLYFFSFLSVLTVL